MRPPAPLALLALAFLLGVVADAAGLRPPPWAPAALPLAASPPLAPLAFGAAGWLVAGAARARPARAATDRLELEGRVLNVPAAAGDRVRFTLLDRSGELLDLVAPPPAWPLAAGDLVRVPARAWPPPGPRNPGAFDQAARLEALGLGRQAEALLPPVRLAPPSPLAWLERGRQRFAEAAVALPPREAGLVRAIGTGDRGGLDAATNDSFARSGLAHVLSVSGLHLVVVAAGLERLLRGALLRLEPIASRWDARRGAALIALPVTVAYTLATGASYPVVRAAIGGAAAFAGTLLDREGSAANALGLATLAVLAVEPGSLLDPSLQLTLASVAGLVALATPIRGAIPVARPPAGSWRARLVEPILGGLAATLAASLATAPVLALQFRRLPALGILSNLAGVPIGTALTAVTALAAVAAAVAPPLATPLLWLCRPLASALLLVSDLAAAPAFAVIGVASPGPLLAGVACGAVLLLGRLTGALRWTAALVAVAAVALPGPLRQAAARLRGQLEVVSVSVGQGDATLLRLPDGEAVLVDGGGAIGPGPDPGARDLVPLLRDLGVTRLSLVVLSHPHPDHVLGLAAVARAVRIDRLVAGGGAPDEAAAAVLALLPPAERLPPGRSLALGGVLLESVGGRLEGLEENDASLVLRIVHGEAALLLPGDLEARGEAAALAGGHPLAAEVVKVPHHGSRGSSTAPFVAAVHPRLAIVSVGARNRYGFPHPEALARWRGAGATCLRTDEGAIRLLSDGHRFRQVPAGDALDVLAVLREREWR